MRVAGHGLADHHGVDIFAGAQALHAADIAGDGAVCKENGAFAPDGERLGVRTQVLA